MTLRSPTPVSREIEGRRQCGRLAGYEVRRHANPLHPERPARRRSPGARAGDACRNALLRPRSNLRDPNFLEAVAEDVAAAVRRHDGPDHPQSLPRHALNTLRWEIPVNLPPLGTPLLLTSEPHSFSRVLTGCFYDTVCNVFAQEPSQDERGLLDAARIAGRLLVTAARNAPEVARFFQTVGQAMILADEATTGGRYRN